MMGDILNSGLEFVRGVQAIESPLLTLVMRAVTSLGSAYFYFIVLAALYWFGNKGRAVNMILVITASFVVNFYLKNFWQLPRPFDLDASLGLVHEKGYGLPSGHAQSALIFWVLLAYYFFIPVGRKKTGIALAIIMPLIIGFSRIYLGVHFPTDVLGGYVIGGIFIGLSILLPLLIKTKNLLPTPRHVNIALVIVTLALNFLTQHNNATLLYSGLFLGVGVGFNRARSRGLFDVTTGEKISFVSVRNLMLIVFGFGGMGLIFWILHFVGKEFKYFLEGNNMGLVNFVGGFVLGMWMCFAVLKVTQRKSTELQ